MFWMDWGHWSNLGSIIQGLKEDFRESGCSVLVHQGKAQPSVGLHRARQAPVCACATAGQDSCPHEAPFKENTAAVCLPCTLLLLGPRHISRTLSPMVCYLGSKSQNHIKRCSPDLEEFLPFLQKSQEGLFSIWAVGLAHLMMSFCVWMV